MTTATIRPPMAEADLQSCIVEACAYLGLPVFHIRDSRRNMGEGFPDLCIADYRAGTVRFWELKTDRAPLRPKQQEWLAALGQCHAVDVRVIRPDGLDGVLEELAR